jgi:hypothetical protein
VGDYRVRSSNVQRIEAALAAETDVEFPGNPLRDVIEYISTVHDIPIIIDEQALSDQGIGADEEVSLVISGISLESTLNIMFENVAGVPLDYIVDNEILKVTTREQADQFLETRVYNIRDLDPAFTGTAVANTIRKSVQPRSWMHIEIVPDAGTEGEMGSMMPGAMPGMATNSDEGMTGVVRIGGSDYVYSGDSGLGQMEIVPDSDGNGTIDALPGCLVITQTQRIHRQIADLLDQLRQHAASAQPASVPRYPGSPSPGGQYTPTFQEVPLGPNATPASTGAYPVPPATDTTSLSADSPYGAPTAPAAAPRSPASSVTAPPATVPAAPGAPRAGLPATVPVPASPAGPQPAPNGAPATAPASAQPSPARP